MQNLHICKICVYANLGHVYTALDDRKLQNPYTRIFGVKKKQTVCQTSESIVYFMSLLQHKFPKLGEIFNTCTSYMDYKHSCINFIPSWRSMGF